MRAVTFVIPTVRTFNTNIFYDSLLPFQTVAHAESAFSAGTDEINPGSSASNAGVNELDHERAGLDCAIYSYLRL